MRTAALNTVKKVDSINVILILLSLVLSFLLPFSLFLFSYAILGPLHYLTEINWLKEKNYFIQSKKWIWFYISMALLISIPPIFHLPFFAVIRWHFAIEKLIFQITSHTDIILLTMLIFAIGVVFLKKWTHTLLFLILSLLISKIITQYVLGSYILIGIFLPTIIHVYLFTFFFMLLGALNSKNKMGWLGLTLLLLSPVIIVFLDIDPDFYLLSEANESIKTARNFRFINYIAECYGAVENGQIISLSLIGVKIQTFVAFCYTYHYLNWFSKTSIIGWKAKLPKNKFSVILLIWLGAIALFLYDYEIAYLALFFLTILHIVLEFPLNVICVREIWFKLIK